MIYEFKEEKIITCNHISGILYEVIDETIELSKSEDCAVHFTFNEIEIVVRKDSDANAIHEAYENACRKNALLGAKSFANDSITLRING